MILGLPASGEDLWSSVNRKNVLPRERNAGGPGAVETHLTLLKGSMAYKIWG